MVFLGEDAAPLRHGLSVTAKRDTRVKRSSRSHDACDLILSGAPLIGRGALLA